MRNTYNTDGNWYKGNLHTHTEYHELRQVIQAYREYLYDFLAVSNHRKCTDLTGVIEEGLTLLPGIEFKGKNKDKKVPHLLGVNVTEDYDVVGDNMTGDGNYQELIDKVAAAGGFSILAHPHYTRDDYWPVDLMIRLQGYAGIEIFNENLIKPNNPRAVHRPLATDVWDVLLSAGKEVWGFACDDFHKWGHLGRAYVMVRAADNSVQSLVAAISRGSFYASTGNLIDEIQINDNKIRLSMFKESSIVFVGNNGIELKKSFGLTGEYDLIGNEGYVRICATNEIGRMAWTQPVFI